VGRPHRRAQEAAKTVVIDFVPEEGLELSRLSTQGPNLARMAFHHSLVALYADDSVKFLWYSIEKLMRFGADHLFKKLRSVLVSKPINYGIDVPINVWQERHVGNVDKALAIRQHDHMVEVLKREGVAHSTLKCTTPDF